MTDPYEKWHPQIDLAMQKHASGLSSTDRQDARQEVMLAFVEAEEKLLILDLQDENRARGFAYRVARNAIIMYIRPEHAKVSRKSISIDDPDVRRGLSMAERGINGSRGGDKFFLGLLQGITKGPPDIDIERALGSLPEDELRVIRGLFFEGRSQEQVAEELGQSRHWVRLKKDLALKELKRLLRN